MNHVFGLIDSMEALILEGKRIPFSEKVLIDERSILQLIDKLRLIIRKGDQVVLESIERSGFPNKLGAVDLPSGSDRSAADDSIDHQESQSVLLSAQEEAQKITDKTYLYSDYILANLQLMVTKLQKNLMTIDRSLESARQEIETIKSDHILT